jgi:hypothetical protein
MNEEAWEAAGGLFCPKCGQETVRILDGLCLDCYMEKNAEREQKQADKAEKRYYKKKLAEGTISLSQLREGRL